MNRDEDLHDSDESDSDFCPEKEAGNEVSEEATSESSSCSDEEEGKGEKKPQRKRSTRTSDSSKNQLAKKLKGRKRANARDTKRTSDTDDESAPAETERKRSTRQTDGTKLSSSSKEKDKLESDEEDKSRSDALWADFLSDVKPKASTQVNRSSATASNGVPTAKTDNGRTAGSEQKPKTEGTPTSKEKHVETKPTEKVKVTEIINFAGEEIRVEKEVSADSVKENKVTQPQKMAGTSTARAGLPVGLKRPMAGGSGGLGSILNQIGKKKKISVLEKSQLDWKSFKQDEGIEEELQTFNKGRDGYLERQDFLQRTDIRQFEIEKNMRQSKRNN